MLPMSPPHPRCFCFYGRIPTTDVCHLPSSEEGDLLACASSCLCIEIVEGYGRGVSLQRRAA